MNQTAQVSLVLLAIVAAYVLSYRFLKLGNPLSMLTASLVGGIVSGFGLLEVFRHIVEGSFTFLNIVLIIYTATLFIYVQKASGGLDAIVRDVIVHFHGQPRLLVILLMFLIMLPLHSRVRERTGYLLSGPSSLRSFSTWVFLWSKSLLS